MQLAEAAVNSQGQNRQRQKSNIRGMSLGLPVSYGLESWVTARAIGRTTFLAPVSDPGQWLCPAATAIAMVVALGLGQCIGKGPGRWE